MNLFIYSIQPKKYNKKISIKAEFHKTTWVKIKHNVYSLFNLFTDVDATNNQYIDYRWL